MGRYRVLDALATLAFDYPARGEYFRRELEQFLLLTRDGELDPLTALGSYAGAMGAAQFMPSSFQHFAVDEDGAGQPDLWTDWADIFGSVANYLQQHGWEYGQPVMAEATLGTAPAPYHARRPSPSTPRSAHCARAACRSPARSMTRHACLVDPGRTELAAISYRVGFRNFYVITRYNRSPLYAMAVQRSGASHRRARAGAGRALMRAARLALAAAAGACCLPPAQARRDAAVNTSSRCRRPGQRARRRAARRTAQQPRQSAFLRRERPALHGAGQRRQLRGARRGLLVRARISRATTPRAASATTCTA